MGIARKEKKVTRMDKLRERLHLVVDYVFSLSLPTAAFVIGKILWSKALKIPLIELPLPGSGRTILLRTISSDVATYNQIFIRRDYDIGSTRHAAGFFERLKKRNGHVVVIDCGANIGCGTAWFATQFPGARIVAVEPDLENWKLLQRNVQQFPNTEALHSAVWSSETDVAIANPNDRPWSYRMEATSALSPNNAESSVKAVTLHTLIGSCDPSAAVIVKMDIEGGEREVFGGDTSWLDRTDLLIIELHDDLCPWQGNSRNVMAAVARRPMDYKLVGENLYCFHDRPMW